MKKFSVVSILSICISLLVFPLFSMEEIEPKRKKLNLENIINLSNTDNDEFKAKQVDSLKILSAIKYLSAAIDSISSFRDLKELLLTIGKNESYNFNQVGSFSTDKYGFSIRQSLEQPIVQEITNLLTQNFKHVLFKIFFKTYLIKNTKSGIYSLSMSDNGKLILFGGQDVLKMNDKNSTGLGLVCFDNLSNQLTIDNSIIFPLKICLKENYNAFLTAISPDANLALNSNEDCCLNLWKLFGLNDVKDIGGLALLESINGSFSSALTLKSIKKINLSNVEGKYRDFRGEIAVITSDNKYALIADGSHEEDDALIIFLDLENETNKVFHCENDISAITLLPNESSALAVTKNGSLIVINFENPEPENVFIQSFKLPINNISSIAITKSGKYALIGSFDKDLLLYNLNNSEDYIKLQSLDSQPISLCLSPDGKQALIISKNGKISLMDLNSLITLKEKQFKMKLLNNNTKLLLDQSIDCTHSIRSKFSSNGTHVLIAYANNHGLNLACLGNLEPLSLEQVVLVAALDLLKNKIDKDSFNLAIKEILEDQECQEILKKFPEREQDLLEKYLEIK